MPQQSRNLEKYNNFIAIFTNNCIYLFRSFKFLKTIFIFILQLEGKKCPRFRLIDENEGLFLFWFYFAYFFCSSWMQLGQTFLPLKLITSLASSQKIQAG